MAASWLVPQPDSSMAWAIVTEAGTPKRCWAAIAPGAIWLMNACWVFVPGVAVSGAVCLLYGAGDDDFAAGPLARAGALAVPVAVGVRPTGTVSPGTSASARG